jgi:hypothetical protein
MPKFTPKQKAMHDFMRNNNGKFYTIDRAIAEYRRSDDGKGRDADPYSTFLGLAKRGLIFLSIDKTYKVKGAG